MQVIILLALLANPNPVIVPGGPGGAATGDILMGPHLFCFDDDKDCIARGGTNQIALWINDIKQASWHSAGMRLENDLNAFGYDITNLDDIYPNAAMASDAAPTPVTVWGSKHPWPGIGGTYTDGAPICHIPASGANNLTGIGTRGDTTDDTLTFTTLDYDCAETVTVLTEGIDYDCDTVGGDAQCVINIAAAVNGLAAALGLNAATVIGETTNFYPTVGTVAWLSVVSSDNANTVIVRGTDGVFKVKSTLEVAGAADIDGTLNVSSVIGTGYLRAGSTSSIRWSSRTEMSSTSDGYWNVTDDAATGFVSACFGPRTDQYPALWPDGSGGVTLAGGAAITDVMNLIVTGNSTVSGTTSYLGHAQIYDALKFSYGTGLDYCTTYDPTGTAFEFESTDVDSSGTDGVVWSVQDGTDNVRFHGANQQNGVETALTDNTETNLAIVNVPSEGHAHGTLFCSIFATDNTDMSSYQQTVTWTAINKAGTITCDTQDANQTDSESHSGGATLTVTHGCNDNGDNTIDLWVKADTSLTIGAGKFVSEWFILTTEDYSITAP